MENFNSALLGLTSGLLKVSGQASLLIVLVGLVQWLGRKQLSPRVRYTLWLLVVARLLLLVSLESAFSVFNFTTAAPANVFRAGGAAAKTSVTKTETKTAPAPAAPAASVPAPAAVAASAPLPADPALVSTSPRSAARPLVAAKPFPWPATLSLVWLAGVVFLLARIIWIPLRLNAQLARHETATPPAVFEILEESKRLIGVNQVLPIIQSRAVESPALLGFIRPWLLLPDGLVKKFTRQELRLVFLHELAHLKRRDIAVNWLATLVQILHWPNPLVWFAFARMRADRELACDELALSFARAEENKPYGHAIIILLEGFARPAALPGLVGILEDKTQMQKRITMIAQFKKMTQWSAAAIGLVGVLGLVTLTDAQTEASSQARAFGADGPRVRTLLSGTSEDVYGSLAPDESAIAYTEEGDKGGHIRVRELATGTAQRIVSASEKEKTYESPSGVIWSPDSKLIAYQWDADDGSNSVRIASRHGGTPRILPKIKEGSWATPVDWSRDGKKLLVDVRYDYTAPNPPTLATLDIESGELQSVGPEGAHARFSPDGRHIFCERIIDGNRDIFVLSAAGNPAARITNWGSDEGCPIFSADGKWILFSSNRRGNWDLWAIRFADGRPAGEAVPVKYNFGDHTKWLMASGKIAFTIASSGVDGHEASDIYKIDLTRVRKGSELRTEPLTRASSGRNIGAAYSPDGKKIAYIRWRGPSIDNPLLCIHTVADDSEKVYDPAMRRLSRIFWSPDGQLIGMAGVGNEWSGGNGTYLFSVASGKRVSERLKRANSELGFAGSMFLDNGKEILASPRDGAGQLAVNIATGEARPLRPEERPGRRVSVVKEGQEERLVYDAQNGDKRVLARVRQPVSIKSFSRSPDGTKVGYRLDGTKVRYRLVSDVGETKEELHVVATDGSWDRIISTGGKLAEGNLSRLSWSPDGTKVLMTLREILPGEIGLVENFLPPEKVAAK
ncbi:MAG: hypothetical protein EXS32_02720 [Opitutus sp.]|nr:hypothetical protein [Opitutus sp.]